MPLLRERIAEHQSYFLMIWFLAVTFLVIMLQKSWFQAKGAVLCYVKHTGPSSILNFFRAFPTSFTATSTMGNLKTYKMVKIWESKKARRGCVKKTYKRFTSYQKIIDHRVKNQDRGWNERPRALKWGIVHLCNFERYRRYDWKQSM